VHATPTVLRITIVLSHTLHLVHHTVLITAFLQNQQKFCLTYEASMTRLYREGRTETVRSCTTRSRAFVLSMVDPSKTMCSVNFANNTERQRFRYVIKRYLEEESPFFDRVFPPTYLLSTSQTPLNQVQIDIAKYGMEPERRSKLVTAGGGFGPVADRGYGVSYIVAGEHQISFHISSKRSAENTSSKEFREELKRSLTEMYELFVGSSK
ncbi:hypothetical protein COOONC_12006, partial [Cooperia oncophora]